MADTRQDDDEDNDPGDQHDDLAHAVGALAFYFTGARVDHHLKHAALKPVSANPDGQQNVLERDVHVPRLYAVDPLLIATDRARDTDLDVALHDLLGFIETLVELHLVALRFEAR